MARKSIPKEEKHQATQFTIPPDTKILLAYLKKNKLIKNKSHEANRLVLKEWGQYMDEAKGWKE